MASTRRLLERTAYHEAGHVVAGFVAGGATLRRVTIRPNARRGSLGHAAYSTQPSVRPDIACGGRTWRRLDARVIITLAGSIAEQRFAGRADHEAARKDYQDAANIAFALNGDVRQTNAYLRWTTLRAEALVETHWRWIVALATALLEHETLTAAQVKTAIGHATRPGRATRKAGTSAGSSRDAGR